MKAITHTPIFFHLASVEIKAQWSLEIEQGWDLNPSPCYLLYLKKEP